jgi:DNA-binding transcriptional LysR family regulator
MNWDDFRFFQAVRKARTLKGAATLLKTDQATVGRRLYALEERLGSKLFEKRSNGYFLTESGERITQSLDRIDTEFDSVIRRIQGGEERLEGPIRIASPSALAIALLIPGLRTFQKTHPQVTLEFLTGPQLINLNKREADVAIRLVRPDSQNLRVRRLGTMRFALYGSPSLWKKGSLPRTLDDLLELPFASLAEDAAADGEMKLLRPFRDRLRPVFRSPNLSEVFAAIQGGIGFGPLPDYMLELSNDLRCFEFAGSELQDYWLVVHSDLKNNAKVRALTEALGPVFEPYQIR